MFWDCYSMELTLTGTALHHSPHFMDEETARVVSQCARAQVESLMLHGNALCWAAA